MTRLSSLPMKIPAPFFRPLLVGFKLLALAGLTAALAASAAYKPEITLTPRDGTGIGTLSSYAGITPVFEPNVTGEDAVVIPESAVKEVNLVWTFWSHTQPHPDQWPEGKDAHAAFTLASDKDTILRLRATYRAGGEWSRITELPYVDLKAGKPVQVFLPLAEYTGSDKIETIRVIINASTDVPRLTVTRWSVGNGRDEPAK